MQKDLSILEKIYKNGNFSGDGLKNSDISVYREKYGKNVITQKKYGRVEITRLTLTAQR